ncbi:MAG: type II secretion system protein N [Parasphingorhabdus sp.]
MSIFDRIFRKNGVYPFLLGLLAILLLIQVIRLIWTVVTPLGPVGDWKANEVQVLPPQSRLSLFSSFDPFFRSNSGAQSEVVTSLQLTLYGIRQNTGSGLGSAILAGPDGVQDSYAIGEEIQSGVTLDAVNFDHVVLDRGGVKETLYLDQSVPAETVGGEASIAATTNAIGLAPALSTNASEIAGFAPRSEDGKITGIVLSPQGDGTLFKTAGFRSGDIITSVNGKPVTSTADIDALKSQIAPGARISVNVERGANIVPISIKLPNNPLGQ